MGATDQRCADEVRAWMVLVAFMFHSATNAFQWMDFTSVSDTAKYSLGGIESQKFNWLYSGGILAACITMVFAMRFMDTSQYAVLAVGVVCNVAGAWLRWLSVHQSSYTIALLSTIFIGVDCGVLFSYFAPIADRWFPERKRSLVVTLAAQSNYAGWCVGSVVIPTVVSNNKDRPQDGRHDLEDLLLCVAIIASFSLPAFLACHRERPSQPPDSYYVCEAESGFTSPPNAPEARRFTRDSSGLRTRSALSHASKQSRASRDPDAPSHPLQELLVCLRNWDYMVQAICCGILQGIGIAVPGVQDEIFSDQGYSPSRSRWTDVLFIGSGVVLGLVLGAFAPRKRSHHGIILKTCFIVSALALVGLVVVSQWGPDRMSRDSRYILYLILMPLCGAGTIGFVGLAIPLCCALVHPVSDSISGGFLELLGQLFAVLFAQVVYDFWVVGGAVLLATVTFLLCFRPPEDEEEEEEDMVPTPESRP